MSHTYSRIIQGCMTWGRWGKGFTTKEMEKAIHHSLEQGITTFDHADIYGDYTTEEEWGHAFAKAKIPREQIQLISKCGIQLKSAARPKNDVKHYQYDKTYIISSVEASLRALQVDYLDLFLLHRPSPLMNPAEIQEAVLELQGSGKIKEFGVSNFSTSEMQLIETKTSIQANQVEISLTNTDAFSDGVLDYCITHNIMPMSWSPLGTVFKEDTPQNERILATLNTLSEKYNAIKDQLLLAWLLKHPAGIHPVIGTTTPERVVQASNASAIKLELKDWFHLLTASTGEEVA